jgi:23S rRNA (adenine2030-N6)-methyltransferase
MTGMNYRHAYHAGNFADVMKHCALILCLDYLLRKDKPIVMIDAHGGCGLYDLKQDNAQKTREYIHGISKIMDMDAVPDDLAIYRRHITKDWKKLHYPGSPLIAARMLRPHDRLIANELHPEDILSLKANLGGFSNARVTQMDAYEVLRAQLPPPERRGLVLIDPPFEKKDEFQTLCKQMKEWKKRWADGVYLVWYPIKAHLPIAEFHDALKIWGEDCFIWEILLHPPQQPETLNGCGLVIINPPYQIPERLDGLTDILTTLLRS